MKKYLIKQPVHLIYNSFRFLEVELGYCYMLIRNTNDDCILHFFNRSKLINLRFEFKENLFEFSICNIISTEYEEVKCLPFNNLFKEAGLIDDWKCTQPDDEGYIKALEYNAELLRQYMNEKDSSFYIDQ